MRQIHVCAWLLLALSACGGGEFTSGGSSKPDAASGSPNAETGGKQADYASGGGPSLGVDTGGGPPASAGSGGGVSVPPAFGGRSSGAGSGSGSGSSSGGNNSGQGNTNSGAAAGNDCASGTITFRMLPSPKLQPDYLCDAGCGTGWISITDADGAIGFPISSACGTASCESCEVRQCTAAACLPTPLTAEGSELVWNGTYLAKDTCGAENVVCQRQACVKPGKYRARACAALSAGANAKAGGCTPNEEQLCTEVEFEFPATKTIAIELGK